MLLYFIKIIRLYYNHYLFKQINNIFLFTKITMEKIILDLELLQKVSVQSLYWLDVQFIYFGH